MNDMTAITVSSSITEICNFPSGAINHPDDVLSIAIHFLGSGPIVFYVKNVNRPIKFKDNFRKNESRFFTNIGTIEAHLKFTGPYKKGVYHSNDVWQ